MPTKPNKLSVEQANAIDLLVAGKADGEVAEAVGVTRQTVCEWRNHNATFAAALNRRRKEAWGANADRLRGLVDTAIDVLSSSLKNEDPKVQQAAAVHVLRAVGLYGLQPPEGPTSPRTVAERWTFEEVLP